jgi:peptide/nickel transport system substrate-binding protein
VGISRGEPPTLAAKALVPFTGSIGVERPAFNAGLDLKDEHGLIHPHLAEAIPQLNSDTWRVLSDGQMETTYRLRPNLSWHDGTPLLGEDFVFAWRVYATPEFGHSGSTPISHMQEVLASEPLTVTIRWRQIYADAADLGSDFPPLPRHLLEDPFRSLDAVGFAALPFWTTEYVGVGAYRLVRWELGAFIEGQAFDAHALGRPKIDRLKIVFIQDPATALANLLAGEAHFVGDFVLTATDGNFLEQMWADTKGGTVLWSPTTMRISYIQLRPEQADPPALLDVRVRRALAYAMDTTTAVSVQHYGKAVASSTVTSPLVDYYREIEPAITKYAHDPRRAAQLLEEAGLVKGPDGFYVDREGKRFGFDYKTFPGQRGEEENAVFVDSLRRVGIDARQQPLSQAEIRDGQALALFPALSFRGTGARYALNMHISKEIPRPETRWQGRNLGGWSNSEYDRLFDMFTGTLDRSEIIRVTAQMEKLFTAELPSIVHYFIPGVVAHVAALKGPEVAFVPGAGGGWSHVYRWEWRQ